MLGCVFAFFALAAGIVTAQTLDGLTAKGGKIPKFDKQNRLESLLSVEEARRSAEFSHIKNLLWMGFVYSNATRITNLVMRSPECFIDNASQSIYSDKSVKLDLGIQEISLEGTGFLLAQTNTSIFISNDVRSVINVPARAPLTNSPASSSKGAPSQSSRYWVDSKQFEFLSKNRAAVYERSVVLTDKQGLILRTEKLSAVLMTETNKLEIIQAHTNLFVELVADAKTNRIEGEQGIYKFGATVQDDIIEINQNPRWTLPAASGNADKLKLFPRLNRFEASGHGFTKLNDPKGALPTLSAGSTKEPHSLQPSVPIELRFGEGTFEPGLVLVTNAVSASQAERLKLECLGLRGILDTNNNALQKLEGNGDVRIQLREKSEIVTAKAQHLDLWLGKENASQMQLREGAEWSTRLYSGKGEVIWIDMIQKTFEASNRASARIVFQSSTNLNPRTKSTPALVQRLGFGADQVDIIAAYYRIRPGSADFEGNVQILNPDWRMDCSRLHFQLNPENNQIENVEALGKVIFERFASKTPAPPKTQQPAAAPQAKPNYFSNITDAEAPWKLTCEKLMLKVSSPANQITVIQASENVVLVQDNSRATGDLLVYEALHELLKLTGSPTVKTESKGEIRGAKNAVLILDIKADKLTNEGVVEMVLPGGAFTAPEVKPRRIP